VRPFFVQTLWLLLALAAVAIAVSAAIAGVEGSIGALAGAGLAILDLGLLAAAAAMLTRRTGTAGVASLGILLALKFPVLGGVLYLLVVPLAIEPVGLALGFSVLPVALVIGVLTGRLSVTVSAPDQRSLG